ncbi:MAG: O-sialoglycoprotein endopeptidase [Acidaminococcales bacterium]|jgi:N6-L-threonylcarbamoyladenine synthase|nr:O-sialoglycoprotein endopeptidase [Acidaminococcales bacterium]
MFLGIDTSCYTTSAALFDCSGALLADKRSPLAVKPDKRGLRQAEMVFQHIKNLPFLLEEIFTERAVRLKAIAVSEKPRPLVNSYMPAFTAGVAVARSLASALGVKLYRVSHQENHIEAGLWSAGAPQGACFIVLHVSGGTTDLILAERRGKRLSIAEIGGSGDLNAGQYIDRIGADMGLTFPAGRSLEALAAEADGVLEMPVAVNGLCVSYSGPFSASRRLLQKGADRRSLAAGIQTALAESFARIIQNACAHSHCREALLVGGVASNLFIRGYVTEKMAKAGIGVYFPLPEFCRDNAAGCAVVALNEGG